jgi:3-oxoadipate enol-lactonase
MHYEVHGSGAPTLFIHGGFGGPSTTLAPAPPPILDAAPLDRVQLVVYDRRCAGLSEYTIDAAYTLDDIAYDARALLAHLGIERAIIVGSSMGGMVAQQYALSYPETVQALALLNTGPRLMFETPWGKQFTEIARRVEEAGPQAIFEMEQGAVRQPPEPPRRANPSPLAAQTAANRERYLGKLANTSDEELFRLWRGAVRNYAAFVGYDFMPRLRAIADIGAPTLIMHGDGDTVVPFSDGEALRDGIGDVEFHAIPDADHGIAAYPAAQVAIRDWLTRMA